MNLKSIHAIVKRKKKNLKYPSKNNNNNMNHQKFNGYGVGIKARGESILQVRG